MAKTKITLALGSYDRHAPLLEDCIQHPQFDVQYVELDPEQGRHERFLQNFEFDAAELSLSSYLIAIDIHFYLIRNFESQAGSYLQGDVRSTSAIIS